jgi:hypothetical protein
LYCTEYDMVMYRRKSEQRTYMPRKAAIAGNGNNMQRV